MSKKIKIIGIDIGGTKCGITLADYDGKGIQFLDKTSFPTESCEATVERLLADIRALFKKHSLKPEDIAAAGINCGGPLNAKEGIILCPPNLPGWVNIPIVQRFEAALGIPCYLQNDANAGAIAEHLFGACKGLKHLVFLTHGTGMGAGLILNGQLYSGANDMAGEVGHLRLANFGPVGFGKAGSFEGFCSGGGIAKLAQIMALEKLQIGEMVGFCPDINALPSITAKSVAEAAYCGDTLARKVFAVSGSYLGKALAIIIDVLNPELILLGSVYGHCKDLLYDTMIAEIKKEAISFSRKVCDIQACGLGGAINEYEAVSIAVYMYSNKN